jgi:ATP-binding cassette, subfamily B, bacterial
MSVPVILPGQDDLPVSEDIQGAWGVLRRGLRESPELRVGLRFTALLSILVAVANLLSPVLVQQIFDKGFEGGFRPVFVYGMCGAAFLVVMLVYLAGRMSGRRLVRASEHALVALRVRAFAHIHRLSIAEQSRERRGVFVSRVTADVETLSHFFEWGGIAWIVSIAQATGSLALMLWFSWQLTIPVVLLVAPLVYVMGRLQGGLSEAWDLVRTRVGEMLSEVSESVMGAAVVRAYGLEDRTDERVKTAIDRRYRAQMIAQWRSTTLFPIATVFGAGAIAAVVVLGAVLGPSWGLTVGRVTAFVFLAQLFLEPLSDLPEIYSETQTAIAGWRKILGVLDLPVEVVEPDPGVELPSGPLSVRAENVTYAYGDGIQVLHGISLQIPARANIAIVGETGCGKTTFAKLLARLADPESGTISVDDVDLRRVAPDARRASIRMVPQDGFLFDTSVRENVRAGRPGATDRDVDSVFAELGLAEWVASLPDGLETVAGERGEALSVGERQLVSLARAQIASPGLLVLDEATSAVDPGTEQRIAEALRRLSAGRTVLTIAHRLSTAEHADRVLVFDAGRLVQEGTHAELIGAGGVYARMYRSWLGNVEEPGVR